MALISVQMVKRERERERERETETEGDGLIERLTKHIGRKNDF